jgi:hypothetical protein
MRSYFELLLISCSIALSSVSLAADPEADIGYTLYISSDYFDTQIEARGLLSDLANSLDSKSLDSAVNELVERQLQNGQLSNLQFFTGALGGIKAPAIVQSSDKSRPYSVMGDTFPDYATAASRACSIQNNNCCDVSTPLYRYATMVRLDM